MKIVFATDNYWPRTSGIAASVDAFKSELEKRGHAVFILAPHYPGSEEYDKKAGSKNVFRFHSHSIVFSREDQLVSPLVKRRVVATLKKIDPDIVHVQTELQLGRWALNYAKKRKIPAIFTCHTYFEGYLTTYLSFIPPKSTLVLIKQAYRQLFNKADHIIVPTPHMHKVLRSYGIVRPIMDIPTGILGLKKTPPSKADARKRSALLKQYPDLANKKILLYVGRVAKEKNLEFLLRMFQKIGRKDAALLVVGDGPFKEELEGIAKDLGIHDAVVFTGYVSEELKNEAYSIADVFVFASKTETQGIVTLEAMNHATPVVAIGVRGTKDVMNGDNGGYMVKDNLPEFIRKVRLLLDDPELLKKKSKQAYVYSNKWTIEASVDKLMKVYDISLKKHTQDEKGRST